MVRADKSKTSQHNIDRLARGTISKSKFGWKHQFFSQKLAYSFIPPSCQVTVLFFVFLTVFFNPAHSRRVKISPNTHALAKRQTQLVESSLPSPVLSFSLLFCSWFQLSRYAWHLFCFAYAAGVDCVYARGSPVGMFFSGIFEKNFIVSGLFTVWISNFCKL